MKPIRTKAIVLRRTNYGEADRILQLLTKDYGKLGAIAKGARREKSKLAGGIELLAISDVTLVPGKSELWTLTGARTDTFFAHIMKDYERLQFGYEAINLTSKASEIVNEPEWFDVLGEVYKGLDIATIPLQLVQAWFYMRCAAMSGYEINLDYDVNGDSLEAKRTYIHDPAERGFRPGRQGVITADHIKFLRLISTKPLGLVARIGGTERILPDVWLVAKQQTQI